VSERSAPVTRWHHGEQDERWEKAEDERKGEADRGPSRLGVGAQPGSGAERLGAGGQGLGGRRAPALGGLQRGRGRPQLVEARPLRGHLERG
jgi:hypothetical protein